jgi:uncharacterized protein
MTDPQPLAPQPQPEEYPFWGWLDVALLSTLALPLILLMAPTGGGAPPPPPPIPRERAVAVLLSTFSFYGVWFLALYALIRLRYGRPFWRSLAWVRPPRGLWDSAGWGLLLALAAIVLSVVLRPPEIKTPLEELLRDPASLMLIGVFGVTLGPLCEELMFRGFLMPLLVRSFGAVAGVLAAAAPFALLHGYEYSWNWQRLLIIFLAGAAFGWMRRRSGSTAAATVMHCAYNLVFFILLAAGRPGRLR